MPKRTLQGVVVSDKQTRRGRRVERRYTHPLFQENRAANEEIYAHDEKNDFKIGDSCGSRSTPISKLKRWAVVAGREKENSASSARRVRRRGAL